MWRDKREILASSANLVVSWYIRLIGLPTEAILLRPRELGWPPGIHALLLISGLRKLLFLVAGEIEPFELFAMS